MRRPTLPPAIPSGFPLEEPVTGKLPAIAEAKELCPNCGGISLLDFQTLGPDMKPIGVASPPDLSQFGMFIASVCLFCTESRGLVTATEAEQIRAAIAAGKVPP